MKSKFVLIIVLLALFLAACGAQDTANETGEVTGVPVVSTDESTETVGETPITPIGAVEGALPTQEAGDAATTPTLSADDAATPAVAGTAVIPQTGPGEAGVPDDLDELIRVVRATGATINTGDVVEQDAVSVPGQIILINGEEVQIFTYESAEALEVQASQLLDDQDPESEPQFYKLGTMLVRYVGRDPGVRDLLEDVLGAQAAGQ